MGLTIVKTHQTEHLKCGHYCFMQTIPQHKNRNSEAEIAEAHGGYWYQ